jgi:transcriptional regulator with XRE-family HTH domain
MKSQAPERTGAAIRKLRLAKGWTLAELADQSGIPVSTLSRVELGQNGLNSDKLVRLCRALEVDMPGLVTREAESASIASGRRSVTRGGQGEAVRLGVNDGRISAGDLLDKSFTPVVLTLNAATLADHGAMTTLPGEAYVLAVSGQAVLHSQLYAPLILNPGDGVYFDGRSPYALLAGAESGATVLLIAAGDQTFKA